MLYGAAWRAAKALGYRRLITYTLPEFLVAPMGASSARVSLSGRNLLTITGYSGTDPEISSTFNQGSLSIGADYFTVPQARQLLFGFDIGW